MMLLLHFTKIMLIHPCGGLAQALAQLIPLSLLQRDREQKGRTGLRMLQGRNKDREIPPNCCHG